MLQKLLQQSTKIESSNGSASLAEKGNHLNALSACKGGQHIGLWTQEHLTT